jgi:RHS repeat-associated protein
MLASSQLDPMLGIDIHWELVPTPAPVPMPIPNPFTGIVFDPKGLAAGIAISNLVGMAQGGTFKGPVFYWSVFPASNTGTEGKHIPGHILIPPGTGWAPVPKTPKPTIHPGETPSPPKPVVPDNDAVIVFGSKTVHVMGSNAVRLGDLAMSCSEPIRLPSSVVLSIPKGAPVLIGGPPSLDLAAAVLASLRTRFVSDSLHALVSRMRPSRLRNFFQRAVCFFTGHPVDVATGKVMTDAVDASLPGPLPLKVERVYSSAFASRTGLLGHGWSLSLDQSIWVERGKVVYLAGDGREIEFDTMDRPEHRIRPGDELWHPVDRLTLRREEKGRWRITTHEGIRHEFGPVPGDRKEERARLLRIASRCGHHEVVFGYDRAGNLEWVRDSGGRILRLAYDEQSRLTEFLLPDAKGWRTHRRYRYDDAGDLLEVVDSTGHSWRFEYVTHLLVRETDRTGLSFYFTYDGLGEDAWCTRTWGDGGIYDHVIRYDKKNHVTFVTNSLGFTTTYFANAAGAVVKVVDAHTKETRYEYDEAFRRVAEIDPLGNTVRFEYDARGNLTKRTSLDGAVVTLLYDSRDLPVSAVDAAGGKWRWTYDQGGHLTEEVNPLGERLRHEHKGGLRSAWVDAAGQRTSFGYDRQKNLMWIEQPNGARLRFQHDWLGRRVYEQDARGAEWRNEHDGEGRVLRVEGPLRDVAHLRYSAEGDLLEVQCGPRHLRFGYAGFHQVAWREEAGQRIALQYDTEGRLTGITNESQETCSFVLDPLGRTVSATGFDGATRRFRHDGVGRVIQVVNPDGKKDVLAYDAAGRLLERRYGDGTFHRFRYRPDGALVAAANDTATITFDRDELGRVVRERQGEHTVSSQYGLDGLRRLVETSLGGRQAILRDSLGEVLALHLEAGAGGGSVVQFERDEGGLEIVRRLPGDVRIEWRHDLSGRPVSRRTLRQTPAAAREKHDLTYRWGGHHQLRELVDSRTGTTVYSHDARGRLIRTEWLQATIHRAMDPVGNVYRTTDGCDRRYGRGGRLEEADGALYTHDANGNLTQVQGRDGAVWRYHWNGAGLLREVERPDGSRVRFEYDAFARRTRKATIRTAPDGQEVVESETRFVWDGYTVIHEMPSQGTPTTWYWEPESFTPVVKTEAGRHWTITTDPSGAPDELYDEAGQIAWQLAEDRVDPTRAGCPWRWPGQYADEETGLHYNWYRYYDPDTDRYLSQDLLGPTGFGDRSVDLVIGDLAPLLGGLHPYSYVDDPLSAIDPLGLAGWRDKIPRSIGGVPINAGQTLREAMKAVGRPGSTQDMVKSLLDTTLESIAKITTNQAETSANKALAETALKLLKQDKSEKAKGGCQR